MTPFDLAEPKTLSEALELLDSGDAGVRAASGCTALMLLMKASVLHPTRLVSLRALAPQLSAIETRDGQLCIGALATLSTLERSPLVERHAPVVARALGTLANVRVRNVATLGGHLAHADPHMDLPPVLAALGADVLIAGRNGSRTIAAEALITGYMETALAGAELITEVRIPIAAPPRAAYLKVTSRSADDWPCLGVAAALQVTGGRIGDARVVVGAAVDRPTRLVGVEAALHEQIASERLITQAGELAASEAQPLADQHGSAAYKRQLIRVYVARVIAQALATPQDGARA